MITKKTFDRLKRESLAHWNGMLAWVLEQPKEGRVDYSEMDSVIKERPIGRCCSFCIYSSDGYGNIDCTYCPISLLIGRCQDDTKNLYDKVFLSPTWGTWAKRAPKFIAQLESLNYKEYVKKIKGEVNG